MLSIERASSDMSMRSCYVSACLCLMVTGCGGPDESVDLTIINGHEPESLDPALITGQADGRAVATLFEGLTRFHAETTAPEPGLAHSWEISDDGRVYRFHLRTNAVWSTGDPITADDFVYSWRRVLHPDTACEYASLLFYVRHGEAFAIGKLTDPKRLGIRAAGPHIFEVELTEPTPFFLDICALPTVCAVPRKAIERWGDRWLLHPPVPVSGSYLLEFWRLNDRIRLRKNPLYWDASRTKSELVDLLPCQSANTALNLYEAGQVDIVWDKELAPTELMELLRQRPDFHQFDYLGSYFIRFNVTRPPFHDVRVRKALALVIDKKRILEKITKSGEKPSDHLVPPGLPGYVSPPGLGYDPMAARRLLEEAGFPDGQGFPMFRYLYNNTGKVHEQIAVELQEVWQRELGIRVELEKLEWKVYLRAQNSLDYDLSKSSWIGDYSDPNTFLDVFLSNNGNNRTGWKSPRYDELLRDANRERNGQRRAELLREAEALLIREEAPIIPIYIYAGVEYYDSDKIRGVYSNVRSEHPIRAIWKMH